MENKPKRTMLAVQMTDEDKNVLRRAAQLEGHLELSAWVRKNLLELANKALKKSELKNSDAPLDR